MGWSAASSSSRFRVVQVTLVFQCLQVSNCCALRCHKLGFRASRILSEQTVFHNDSTNEQKTCEAGCGCLHRRTEVVKLLGTPQARSQMSFESWGSCNLFRGGVQHCPAEVFAFHRWIPQNLVEATLSVWRASNV